MNTIDSIYQKLEQFIRKYYTNQLIKGSIFFVGFGLCYFLFTLFVEYFLWLNPFGRTILFWSFVAVEFYLFLRFICFPIFKLFKIQKGIDYNQASKIIGNHFREVNDKLTNFLQLAENSEKSELLLASIEQKANNLSSISFAKAVDFKKSYKYFPLAIVPVLLFLLFFLSGNSSVITQSIERVVHYGQRYAPPAPFAFFITNSELKVNQGEDFIVNVKITGKLIPEQVMIVLDNESYYLENVGTAQFQYRFNKLNKNVNFYLQANKVYSNDYTIEVVEVPVIANFEMQFVFPTYLGKKPEKIKGTGNAIIPEGTKIIWNVNTKATENVEWTNGEISTNFTKENNLFSFAKNIFQNTDYQIITSNKNSKNHEKLHYKINVIKDNYPNIKVENIPDSLGIEKNILIGEISDDYGLTKLQIVYYQKSNPKDVKTKILPINKGVFDRFHYTFPEGLEIESGVEYEYYFEVFDNDAIHNFKSSKSIVFSDRERTKEEKQEEILKNQYQNINSLSKSMKSNEKQLSEMDKLQQINKENKDLDFKDQKKIDDFLKRQMQQEEMMQSFSEKLKDNITQTTTEQDDKEKELLEKRLEEIKKESEKNKKLLEELKELSDKLKKEELFDKMEKYQQKAKSEQKSLEQLVELTKRFYVKKKMEKIASDLNELAKKQDNLSEETKQNNTSKQQEELNKQFEKIQQDINDLNKENKELKTPLEVPLDKKDAQDVKKDMENAKDNLDKNDQQQAKPKQKSASKKMKQMSQKVKSQMKSMKQQQMQEDAKMLRQILDNLLAFSFSQEDIMEEFKNSNRKSPSFANNLKIQHNLKMQFGHVEDSLFALSLRNPMIGEEINKEIGEVSKGVSHQQYTITSANKLASFLADVQQDMQMSGEGEGDGENDGEGQGSSGKGKGKKMQLQDIIQKQEELMEKMQDGMDPGDNPGEQDGDEGEQNSGNQGNNGENGQGQDGEAEAEAIYEIYKEQQMLREALRKQLEKEGLSGAGQNATKQMQDIEKQLLNKRFDNSVLQKMQNLKHELLKLEKAVREQGEDHKRQGITNKTEFNTSTKPLDPKLQDYLNSIEILNRDALPIHPTYNQKVQEYFRK